MIRIQRIHGGLWRPKRKLPRNVIVHKNLHVDTNQSIVPYKKCITFRQQSRYFRTSQALSSTFTRVNASHDNPTHRTEGKYLTSVTDNELNDRRYRLDAVPNDLNEVVEKMITYLEVNHNDKTIRDNFMKNYEFAKRHSKDYCHPYRTNIEKGLHTSHINTKHVNGSIKGSTNLNGDITASFNVNYPATLNGHTSSTMNGYHHPRMMNGHHPTSLNGHTPITMNGHHPPIHDEHHSVQWDSHHSNVNGHYMSFDEMVSELTISSEGRLNDVSYKSDSTVNGHHLSFDEMVSELSISSEGRLNEFSHNNDETTMGGINNSNDNTTFDVQRDQYTTSADTNSEYGMGMNGSHHLSVDISNKQTFGVNGSHHFSVDNNNKHKLGMNGSHHLSVNINNEHTQGINGSHASSANTPMAYSRYQMNDKDVNNVAIYHALKNDIQFGGHIPAVVNLTSKSDAIPFANVDTLIAENLRNKSPSDDVALDDSFTSIDPEFSTIPDIDSPEDLSSHEIVEESITGRRLDEKAMKINSFPTDSTDLEVLSEVSYNERTIPIKLEPTVTANDHNMFSGFHSDLDISEDAVNSEQISPTEQARRDSVVAAVALLRTLTEDHWILFRDFNQSRSHIVDSCENSTLEGTEHVQAKGTVDALSELLSIETYCAEEMLTTSDYNYSIARLAIATDTSPEKILGLLMQTHEQMNELAKLGFLECSPNAVTHEILLLTMVRRFCAFHNAIDLAISLSKSPNFSWTPKTLQAASELCARKDLLRMSRDMMYDLQNALNFKIPKRVFFNLIDVYKDNDSRNDAIEMLRLGLKQSQGRVDRHLDEIFVHTIRWPTKSRLSGFIDNSSIFEDILSLLENEFVYSAGFPVWKELIVKSSFGANQIPARWEYVIKSFQLLSVAEPMFWPDHQLLRQGLLASERCHKADLASDLIRRAIINYNPRRVHTMKSPLYNRPNIPFQSFVSAILTCVKANDMIACERIMNTAKYVQMTPTNIRSLYVLALKGYANAGDSIKVNMILDTMKALKLHPGEDCYGALFYAYAASNQLENARNLLQNMESGAIGVTPGPTCYDGFIMASARHRAWEDILAAYETMKLLDISLSSASCHGILLAAYKLGNKSDAMSYVDAFVMSNAQLYGDGALLALRLLLGDIIMHKDTDRGELSLDVIRERLRILGEENVILQEVCLQLIRSLRIAESEELRHVEAQNSTDSKCNVLPLSELMDRRHVAWNTMLTDLLRLVRTIDIQKNEAQNDEYTPGNNITSFS